MKYGGLGHVTWPQYEAAKRDRGMGGDIEALEDLGYVMTPETLARHAAAGAEVARLLGVDMRTARERARTAAHAYYAEQFGLSVVPEGLEAGQQETITAWVR